MQLTGYHGTSQTSGEMILKENYVKPSQGPDEWMGKGAYFFYSREDAVWWCQNRHFIPPCIIEACIEGDCVLDLVGNRSDQEKFAVYCQEVKKMSPLLPNHKERDNYSALAFAALMKAAEKKNIKFDFALACFAENRKFWNKIGNEKFSGLSGKYKFPQLIGQIQICVYNQKSIKHLKGVG